jgi:hypothetical protein
MMVKKSVLAEWLKRKDSAGIELHRWLNTTDDEKRLLCSLCSSQFSCDKKGFQSVQQHYSTEVHKSNAKVLLDANQLQLTSRAVSAKDGNAQLQLGAKRDIASAAELRFVMKCVQSNLPLCACDGTPRLFKEMFPDSQAVSGFTLCAKKAAYLLTDALDPFFRDHFFKDVKNSRMYSVSFDETTNVKSRKELQVRVKYWSESSCIRVSRHMSTVFIGKATAEILVETLVNVISETGLSLNDIVSVSCDGPNVNKKVIELLNGRIKDSFPQRPALFDLGTCPVHVVHNAFHKGVLQFGQKAAELAYMMFHFFDGWPLRQEEYCTIQRAQDVPEHKFIKHLESRWLTLGPAILRVIEQWPAASVYFEQHSKGAHPSAQGTKILRYLTDPIVKAEAYLVASSAPIFEEFCGGFQTDAFLVHRLYPSLKGLVLKALGRICTADACKKWRSDTDYDVVDDKDAFLPLQKIVVSDDLKRHLSEKLTELQSSGVQKSVREHYKAAVRYVLDKSGLRNKPLMRSAQVIEPAALNLTSATTRMCNLARALPAQVPLDVLQDEMKHLLLIKGERVPEDDAERFWRNVFELKNSDGASQFPLLTVVVKGVFTLSHSNADVERGFSISGSMLTPLTNRMELRMLNARLLVRDSLKLTYGNEAANVIISKDLLSLARCAHQSYQAFLDQEKKKQDEDRLRLEAEVQRKNEEAENKKRLELKRKGAESMEASLADSLREEKAEAEVVSHLLKDAKKKLEEAVKNNNITQVRTASALLETASDRQKELMKRQERARKINNEMNKTKNRLIASFLKK